MDKIIRKIMGHPSLINHPPVLVDIGASGFIHKKWNKIAKYSICIAFDADTRDFEAAVIKNKGWKKIIKLNRLVTEKSNNSNDFYLTESPHCSSLLLPDSEALEPWAFHSLFTVVDKIQLPSTDLSTTMKEVGLKYIDWFKTDSQGTDLRIYRSIGEEIRSNIITAEFEPGIIDAMQGEDKLHALMQYMDEEPFWISSMGIHGSYRISQNDLQSLNFIQRRLLKSFLKQAPGWCEIVYINNMESNNLTIRHFLLAWLFATINGEHGFGLLLSRKGFELFEDQIFLLMKKTSYNKINYGYITFFKDIIIRIVRFIF